MARLSGLASDHHPQGPGDAPRRKKRKALFTTPSRAQKRPASPAPAVPQVKRTRLEVHEEEDENVDDSQVQLARELQDSVSRSQSRDVGFGATGESSTHRRERRHSEPLAAGLDEPNDSQMTPPPSTAPVADRPNVLRRTSGVRRARMSMPAQLHHADEELDGADRQQFQFAPLRTVIGSRVRRRLRRSHLSQEVNSIEQHDKEDKKMRKQYAELRAKLLEKDETIRALEFQLEARRMGNIDMTEGRAQELEEQLDQAKDEIELLRRSSLYNGDDARDSREHSAFSGGADDMGVYDDDDDGDLILIDPTELDGPTETTSLVNGVYAQRALELSSQVTAHSLSSIAQTQYDSLADPSQTESLPASDKISDRAVTRYENEIERLIQQLSESQGALRVVAIELQNLNVLPPGASTNVIINNLRHAFEALREELENLLPKCTLGLTNSELLRKIPELFEDMMTELREKTVAAETKHQTVQVLRHQYEFVIDLLARSEERIENLEQNVSDLEHDNQAKQETVDDLGEQVNTLNGQLDEQDALIVDQTAEITGLKEDVADKETSLDRLRDSLETYRNEVNTLTSTVTQLEEEHRETLAALEKAHAVVVNDLERRLVEEHEGRTIAETDAIEKTNYIEDLEKSVNRMETEFEVIRHELDQLRDRLATETELRKTTEEERDVQTNLAYDHANRIENLEETLGDVQTQLADMKQDLANEHARHADTQERLQSADDEIAQLEDRLRNAGVQANELRSKLFQVQQEKEQAVADMEEVAREQARLNQEALNEEAEARDAAEAEVAALNAEIVQLQNEIHALNQNMDSTRQELADTEEERVQNVTALETQLSDLRQKYAALENSSNSTITSLQANITDLTNKVNAQAAELDDVRAELAETDAFLRADIADKTTTISELEADLADEKSKNADLERENRSLAERVEEEAFELLGISDSHYKETTALQSAIKAQQDTIALLQNDAIARESAHNDLIASKETEIQELHVLGDARVSTIAQLETQVTELKEMFQAADADTRNTIDQLMDSQRALQLQNQNLAHELKKRNSDTLRAMKDMKVAGLHLRTNGANGDLHRVAHGKVAKVNERVKVSKRGVNGRKKEKIAKRQWDSGFHEEAAGDEDEDVGVGAQETEDEAILA